MYLLRLLLLTALHRCERERKEGHATDNTMRASPHRLRGLRLLLLLLLLRYIRFHPNFKPVHVTNPNKQAHCPSHGEGDLFIFFFFGRKGGGDDSLSWSTSSSSSSSLMLRFLDGEPEAEREDEVADAVLPALEGQAVDEEVVEAAGDQGDSRLTGVDPEMTRPESVSVSDDSIGVNSSESDPVVALFDFFFPADLD